MEGTRKQAYAFLLSAAMLHLKWDLVPLLGWTGLVASLAVDSAFTADQEVGALRRRIP